MTILSKLAVKNMKLNKKRSIGTVVGIILSVALICAVTGIGTSFQQTLVSSTIAGGGYYHIELTNITAEDVQQLTNNRDIKDVQIMYDLGYSDFDHQGVEDDPYIHVLSFSDTSPEALAYSISEGKMPTNSEEIAISEKVATDSNYKIGDTIELDVGTREVVEDAPDNSDLANNPTENLVNTVKKVYTITGIVTKPHTGYMYYGITSEDESGEIDAYLALTTPKNYKTDIPELLGLKNYDEVQNYETAKYTYSLNDELLRWEVFAFSDQTVSMLYSIIAVVVAIIMITSIFCIRNSFAIAITEKIKMYGMLASIGATKRQIKKNVIFEGLLFGIIGIPIGILFGILATFLLIQIVNLILGDFLVNNMDGMVFSVSWIGILFSAVLGFVTIYLSAISSARRASRVSPIEQLKNTKEITVTNKLLKTPKFVSRLFGTGGVLAYKNLKRSRKKYRTTVISLTVSIFVFISMSAFLTQAFSGTERYYTSYDYNIGLYDGISNLEKSQLDKIQSVDGIDSFHILYEEVNHGSIEITDSEKINPIEGVDLSVDEKSGKAYSNLCILALDSNSFKEYAEKIGVRYETVQSSGILCDDYWYYTEKKQVQTRRYNYSTGDELTGTLNDSQITVKVGAVSDTRPYGLESTYYDGGYLIVDKSVFEKDISFVPCIITMNANNVDGVIKEIEQISSGIQLYNFEELAQQNNAINLVFSIFLYGFITVITLIGVTNIFNTITSNMELRQREFAVLKSIGMTNREFNRMINLETFFYSAKSLLYGIFLGLLGAVAIHQAFGVQMETPFKMPYIPIIISIIFVFGLVYLIMRYSIGKINKQNIMDTIRKENI